MKKPSYRSPEKVGGNWHYIGDGKLHDPSLNSKEMKGRWTIDYNSNSGQSFDKLNQN